MNRVFAVIISLLLLTACGFAVADDTVAYAEDPIVAEEPLGPYGHYGRLSEITVHDVLLLGEEGTARRKKGWKTSALKRLDDDTLIKLFAKGYKSRFTEIEAAEIADYLESPEGQEGVRILGDWLLSGKYRKKPPPVALYETWKAFSETAAGAKFLLEITEIYQDIMRLAVKWGVAIVKSQVPD